MNEFDKKIKKLSKEFQMPDTYYQKMDGILEKVVKEDVSASGKKPFKKAVLVLVLLCLVVIGYITLSNPKVAEASFLETFKKTIMDFLGMEKEDSKKMGVTSEKEKAISRPDLMIELQEVLMDTQNIYAVVKITAPPDVEFQESMKFDYYGFCEGSNYNVSSVVAGARDCTLLEVMEGRKNVALYVINVVTDKQIEEEKEVTLFLKDLIAGPYENQPTILVEGMWSLSFVSSYTESEKIVIQGTEDMRYSFLDTTAAITKIKFLPLGMTMMLDVSNVPLEVLNVSDTRLTIRLKMIDGSEKIVESPNAEGERLVSGSSFTVYEKGGKVYYKYVSQFGKAIDTKKVLGLYVEDCYVPFKDYE